MAGNTKDRIVTGLLCRRKADGSPVVTHVIVREFQWNAGKKARLGDYRYVGIKAWKNSTSKAKFIGDKEKNTLYKKGKLRVIYADKTGVAARGVGVLYLDEAGVLREYSEFSSFVERHRGEYALLQGVSGSAKLSSLEEQAVTLLEDNEYKLNRARNRMTGEDCTISEVAEDGVHVTGLIVGSENLTKIGEAAFANNSSLKSLVIGEKARLSELSFDECSGLTSIIGVERAKAISMSAFAGCYNINKGVREVLRARGVYTDMLTLTHQLSDSAYKKFRSFCSGVSLTPSECVYLHEFIQKGVSKKGVSKEEVSRVIYA